jgi:glucose-1-phosphate cytidylyltransferase
MKTVILAGGRGTRLSEETGVRPKPMIEIGGVPILVHILRLYAHYGFKEFLLALGYRGEMIKDYFTNYQLRNSDITVDLSTGNVKYATRKSEDWVVHLVETGQQTMTGGRLHRLESNLRDEGTFMVTYGDGVADVDISALVAFHRSHGKIATVTAVRPPGRFGAMTLKGDGVTNFKEKPQTAEGWINGGFFVFEPEVFEYLSGDQTVLEQEPLERLSADGQLMAYRHDQFWYAMDTVRDREVLNQLWIEGKAPWNRVPRL